ncbi:DUF805 domain-containing protein [Labrenzia sp. OB1]|uniref:DUF805 domain-containing protein n=1 Tax=Labrenzia sp. OB1 TaxID=1561204 RepID=UPI000AC68852|nr:DUF805 domain-containing protein [Labrenzia sp. OB1]
MQRKEFGRRGLSQENPSQRGKRQSHYSSGRMTASYAQAGGALALDDADSFSLWTAFSTTLALLFSFQGRIGRMEYWSIGIARCVLLLALFFALIDTTQPGLAEMDEAALAIALFTSTSGLVYTALFIAGIVNYWSLEARRCHDRDVSGLVLLLLFVPIFGTFYALYLFIMNGFFPGTPGTNRFDTAQGLAPVFD